MNLRAVLFDLDDTLYDRHSAIIRYTRYFYDDFHSLLQPVSLDDLAHALVRADGTAARPQDLSFQKMHADLPWQKTPPSWQAIGEHWYAYFPLCAQPEADLIPTLTALRQAGFALGIITNGKTRPQQLKLNHLGIADFFSLYLDAESSGLSKPDPRIFHLAARQLNIAPDTICFVGDNPVDDVQAAHTAGLHAVWLRRPQALWQLPAHVGPVFITDHLAALIPRALRLQQGTAANC
ncbi:MAG: HAD family hydrolase [Firmicutes bacterium]|nr:HAD family hydrolase [Bacillota bacterium]